MRTSFPDTKVINLWRTSEPNGHKIASPGKWWIFSFGLRSGLCSE